MKHDKLNLIQDHISALPQNGQNHQWQCRLLGYNAITGINYSLFRQREQTWYFST